MDHNGNSDIVLTGCKKSTRFFSRKIEEAKASLFGLQCAKELGLDNLIVKVDCLPLIQKQKYKKLCDSFIDLVVPNILGFFL